MIVIAAGLAGLAAWLVVRPSRRLNRSSRQATKVPGTASHPSLIRVICAGTGLVIALVVGSPWGIALGVAVALAGPRFLTRLESRADRDRRQQLERQAPAAADLLAACLAAGATPVDAVRAVSRALGEPIAEPLSRLTGALDLGADPVTAWAALGSQPSLRPLARAASRSAETGAPLADVLTAVADDQRDESRTRAEAAARSAGVRSVAPLVACFLPAFVLVGIVPVVASLALPLLHAG